MKAEYKRDLQNNYLILEAPGATEENSYGLCMAEKNQIRGLLPVHHVRRDGRLYLHYEITSRQPLTCLYEKKKIDSRDMLLLFSELKMILEEMRRYLLSPGQLLFDPELIYMEPGMDRIQLCYYPGQEETITAFAEFLLKKLDHEDGQAVSLGYGFYQEAAGENFSLTDTVKHMLQNIQAERPDEGKRRNADGREDTAGRNLRFDPTDRNQRSAVGLPEASGAAYPADGRMQEAFGDEDRVIHRERQKGRQPGRVSESLREDFPGEVPEDYLENDPEPRGEKKQRRLQRTQKSRVPNSWQEETQERFSREYRYRNGTDYRRTENRKETEKSVFRTDSGETAAGQKKTQRRKPEKGRLWELVHPAVFFSFLLLVLLLEFVLYFGLISLTAGGGCFFLLLSAEMLLNRLLRGKKEKTAAWEAPQEDLEEYQELLDEMYGPESDEERPEPVEATRFLEPADACLFRLAAVAPDHGYPDILIGKEPLYIGKLSGKSDVILDCDTVSRTHARLEAKQGSCFVQDLNSKNGTFLNGRRLMPQEQEEIRPGDMVTFAEAAYRVEPCQTEG